MFSDNNDIKLETNNRIKWKKSPCFCKLRNAIINNSWVKGEIRMEIWKYFELNEKENTAY